VLKFLRRILWMAFYTHGINRFVSFINMVENGFVVPNNEPLKLHATNALEQWDGPVGTGSA
jgi:3-dehydro-L-gulonate 2-dehydrogenase